MGYSVYMLMEHGAMPMSMVLICAGIFVFFWIWIFFGELRTKAITVSLNSNHITVRRYFGLGRKKVFHLTDFDGYRTSTLSSEYQTFEFLYLLAGKRKVVKLSEFYHKNYPDLKSAFSGKLKNLGNEKFSLIREVKEIFT